MQPGIAQQMHKQSVPFATYINSLKVALAKSHTTMRSSFLSQAFFAFATLTLTLAVLNLVFCLYNNRRQC